MAEQLESSGASAPRRKLKASDEQLTVLYGDLGSVWEVGKRVGMCGQSVHERLQKLGIVRPMNVFTEAEIERLKLEYWLYADTGKLAELAEDMGRTKHLLCRKARELGLTDKKRRRPWTAVWKYISEEGARALFEKFKESSLGLGMYCRRMGYDDLGFARAMRRFFPDEWEPLIELKAGKQTKYRIGRAFEYRVRDHLKGFGFFVTRSPQSKSPVDLTAIRKGQVVLVQCKRGGSIGVVEWNELFDLATSIGAVPILAVMTPDRSGPCYTKMIGRKDGSKRRQPMEPWAP